MSLICKLPEFLHGEWPGNTCYSQHINIVFILGLPVEGNMTQLYWMEKILK